MIFSLCKKIRKVVEEKKKQKKVVELCEILYVPCLFNLHVVFY